MLWLPDVENFRRRLPLADFSAAALLSAKLTSGDLAAVRDVLERDAALSLWAVCRAAAEQHSELRTCDSLADWLTANANRILVWPDLAEQAPDDPAWLARHRRFSAVSAAVACHARSLAGESHDLGRQAFLLGLLHLARQWWELDDRPQGERHAPLLPAWLSASLNELFDAASSHRTEAARLVAAARQECDEAAALAEYDRLTSAGPLACSAIISAASCLPSAESRLQFDERLTAAKLAAMAEFAAGAGHEINNPLAVICGRAQLLLQSETNAQRRHELAVINGQAMRVYEMISDMMLFARPPEPKLAACDVAAVTRQVVQELASKANDRQVEMRFAHDSQSLMAHADAMQLAVALRALCDNALAAARPGGNVTVAVAGHCMADGSRRVLLSVADDGPGIASNVGEHLFDPFFSGRQAGRGLGMGLAKAWRIVSDHRGKIEFESVPGETTFTIILPAIPPAPGDGAGRVTCVSRSVNW